MSRKPLRMIVRLVNNQMRERREEAGLSQEQLADRIGITLADYGGLETMREKPVNKKGQWRPCALAISEYHGVAPEELFPEVVLGVERAVVERRLDATEICSLLPSYSERAAMGPESMLLAASTSQEVDEAMSILAPREKRILRRLHGLRWDNGIYSRVRTTTEVANLEGISVERIKQVNRRALGKLRKLVTHD